MTVLISQDGYLIEEIDPEVSLEELEKVLEPAVLEYYENNNAQEFVVCIVEYWLLEFILMMQCHFFFLWLCVIFIADIT